MRAECVEGVRIRDLLGVFCQCVHRGLGYACFLGGFIKSVAPLLDKLFYFVADHS